jgi:hypothetical protein
MSQPAVEVTGSQEVGSSHSQLSVPLAPSAAAVDPDPSAEEPPVELPQAASTAMATMDAAAAALLSVRRDLSRLRGRERITGMEKLRVIGGDRGQDRFTTDDRC